MPPRLAGARVVLRPAAAADWQARLRLGRHAEIAEMFGVSRADVSPITEDQAKAWANGLAEHPCGWVIECDTGLIGEARLDRIDANDRRASYAVAIYDPALLGKGLGTEVTRLVAAYAFTGLNLHRLGLRVLAYNARAVRSYQKCGFAIEGREREAAWVNGQWHDDLIMGLLAQDFSH